MASAFATQLKQIATKSTAALDLKAQKLAHSKSLIFAEKDAATQDFDTIYQLCLEGFDDLCNIDPRFRKFRDGLFSAHSKSKERDQMTVDQNETLDTVVESCIGLLGGRLLLSPAIKTLEWLVRRYRVHEHNTSFLLLTFLPYHGTPIFRSLLSILPPLSPHFKWLGPYMATITNPPRHAVVYGAINNNGFFEAFNDYALQLCRSQHQNKSLSSFWTGVTAEGISGRLDLATSGRREIQQQQQEDVLLKVLPIVSKGLSIQDVPEAVVASYTFALVLASKGQLSDGVIDGLMIDITASIKSNNEDVGLICLSMLASHRVDLSLNKKVLARLVSTKDLVERLEKLRTAHSMQALAFQICQSIVSRSRNTRKPKMSALVEQIVGSNLMDASRKTSTISSIFAAVKKADQDTSSTAPLTRMIENLRHVPEIGSFNDSTGKDKRSGTQSLPTEKTNSQGSSESGISMIEDGARNLDQSSGSHDLLQDALDKVPRRTVNETTFLSHSKSHLFEPLAGAFRLAALSEDGRRRFGNLPLWESSADPEHPLFSSFLVRISCGPDSVQVRQAALKLLESWFSQFTDLDSQAIIPYIFFLLSDPSYRIRREAAELLIAVEGTFSSTHKDEPFRQWGSKGLYDLGGETEAFAYLPAKNAQKILERAVIPLLEDCVLDPSHIQSLLQNTMKSRRSSAPIDGKMESLKLKKYLRQGLFQLIIEHVKRTSSIRVQGGLLYLLKDIDRVESTTKSKELVPLLQNFARLTHGDIEELVASEHLDGAKANLAFCSILSASDKRVLDEVQALASSTPMQRSDFLSALSERVQIIWPSLSQEQQVLAADDFLAVLSGQKQESINFKTLCDEIVRPLNFSTDILSDLLSKTRKSINSTREASPAKKRKAADGLPISSKDSLRETATTIRKLTIILEIVDDSSPGEHTGLIGELFQVLAALHQLQISNQSELSYLLSLVIGNLLNIVRHTSLHTLKSNVSAKSLDVVIDCMRQTSNHQVQNTALLLISELANVVPRHVLESIMSIFTFMSTTMVGKTDEYSVHVVDQTMDKVIPCLVEAFQSSEEEQADAIHTIMYSFVVTYEHIPSEKRLPIFHRLLQNLKDVNRVFEVILGLLARYGNADETYLFILSLINTYSVEDQLKTCLHILGEVTAKNVNTTESNHGIDLDGAKSGHEKDALYLLKTLNIVFTQSNLAKKIQFLRIADLELSKKRSPAWLDVISRLLRASIELVSAQDLEANVSVLAKVSLSSFLSLIPTPILLLATRVISKSQGETWRKNSLDILEQRLRQEGKRASLPQPQALEFLIGMLEILQTSNDDLLKLSALACADKVCGLLGRKHVSEIVQAAEVIASQNCLGSSSRRLNTLALLSLSTIVDLVEVSIVPVIPQIVPRIFELLRVSPGEEKRNESLFVAALSLLSALLTHAYFLMPALNIDETISFCAGAAKSGLKRESLSSVTQVFLLLGRNVSLVELVPSIQRTLPSIIENDIRSVEPVIGLLQLSVKVSSKPLVVKNAEKILPVLLQMFDVRRIHLTHRNKESYTEKEIEQIETSVHPVVIEIIYKLNDTTFRPMFQRLVDWAIKFPDIATTSTFEKGQALRQTTFFNFMAHFFFTLKSLVTSYAAHIIEPALVILNSISSSSFTALQNHDLNRLHVATLSTIHAILVNDQDAYSSNPALFKPLAAALVAQLTLNSSHERWVLGFLHKSIIPPLVSLASAIIDTPDHVKALNTQICALRRHQSASVRLASVKTHLLLSGATFDPRSRLGDQGPEEDGDNIGLDTETRQTLAEEWCNNALGIGEGLVYINELEEDDDEDVEKEVRRLARRVADVQGDDGGVDL